MISYTALLSICSIVFFTITILLAHKFGESVFSFLIVPLFALGITFIFVEAVIQHDYSKKETVVDSVSRQEVMSLTDSISTVPNVKGTFLLGTGSITVKEKQISVYNALVGNADSGYKMESFEMKDTPLYFDEETHPYVHTKVVTEVTSFNQNWLNGGLLKFRESDEMVVSENIELHLPKNTQKVSYEVNLK